MSDPATAFTTISFIDFCVGILGNLVARHGDPAFESLAVIIRERIGKGGQGLPLNHDVERSCRESLQQALRMLAQAMALRIQRPKTLADAFRNRRDEAGRLKPLLEWKKTAEGTWFDEFEREIKDDKSLELFRLPISDASSLNLPVRNQPDNDLEKLFHDTLLDWAERRVQVGTPPACFKEFVEQGWPVRDDSPGVRITLYQAWCLFLQDKVKHDQASFRILVCDWLAKIDSRLASIPVSDGQLLNAVELQLGEQREILIALRDDVARLLAEVGNVGVSLGELLSLASAFQKEVGEGFDGLRAELCEIHDLLSPIAINTEKTLRMQAVCLEDTAAIRGQLERIEVSLVGNFLSVSTTGAATSLTNPFPSEIPPVNKNGFVDCRNAFDAFEHLLKPDNAKRVLLLEGEGEHGKSELTTRFYSHARNVLPPHSTAFIRFGHPVQSVLRYLDSIIESLGQPISKTGTRAVRNRKLIEARAALPTVLFVDGYEHSEDEHRLWLGEILDSVLLRPLMRIVIAGRRVPSYRSQPWTEHAVHVHCDPFREPEAFIQHGTNCRSNMSAEEIRTCCQLLQSQRDYRKQNGLPTDGLSPLTLIGEISRRSNGGASV